MDVLLIDDNKDITEAVSFFLDSHDVVCEIENDAKNALEKIKTKTYDLIILDLTMPVFSGSDLFESLKREDLVKKNNIVIFTAIDLSEENIEQLVKGIMQKPLSMNAIIETINTYR